jgi:hypothetical protein
MLCAIVLGMLTTPLQINFKIHAVQDASHTPDSFIKVDARAFNDDFIEEFFLDEDESHTIIAMPILHWHRLIFQKD